MRLVKQRGDWKRKEYSDGFEGTRERLVAVFFIRPRFEARGTDDGTDSWGQTQFGPIDYIIIKFKLDKDRIKLNLLI